MMMMFGLLPPQKQVRGKTREGKILLLSEEESSSIDGIMYRSNYFLIFEVDYY